MHALQTGCELMLSCYSKDFYLKKGANKNYSNLWKQYGAIFFASEFPEMFSGLLDND